MSESSPSVRREVLALASRHRGPVSALVAASLVAGLGESTVLVLVVKAAARATHVATDAGGDFLPHVGTRTMLLVAACAAFAVIAMHWLVAVVSAAMCAGSLRSYQDAMASAFVRASWSRQSLERSGRLQESIAVLAPQAAQVSLALGTLCAITLTLVALLTMALLVDALATALVVVLGAVLFAVLRPLTRRTGRRAWGQLTANSDYINDVARGSAMAMEVHSFGVGEALMGELRRSSAQAAHRVERLRRVGRFSANVYRDVAMLLLVGAVLVLDVADGLDAAAFGAVVLMVVRSVQCAQSGYEVVTGVRELLPSVIELRRRIADLGAAAEVCGTRSIASIEQLEMRAVEYAYDEGTPTLQGIDLTIRRGEVVGLVGPSGGGKSTIVQLLTRLRRPDRGSVLVDGVDYTEIDTASWTSLVAFVSQEPHLMEGSIADNIRFWRAGIADGQVRDAARRAHVLDEIEQLPEGFATVLGPGGSGLSGGQKQRVAIARALVGNPVVLVLDEPTSALDGVSEALVRDTLVELKGTTAVVVVAHRPSTLEVCDRTLTITHGTLTP